MVILPRAPDTEPLVLALEHASPPGRIEDIIGRVVSFVIDPFGALGNGRVRDADDGVIVVELEGHTLAALVVGLRFHIEFENDDAWWKVNGEVTGAQGDHRIVCKCAWPPTRHERRHFYRVKIALRVWIIHPDDPMSSASGTTLNISGGGLAVAPTPGLATGVTLPIVIDLDDGPPIIAVAKVKGTERHPDRYRLQFTQLATHDEDRIVRLVNTRSARRPR